MKIQTFLLTTAIGVATLFGSCKKADDAINGGGSGDLAPGKGKISFNTSSGFGGNFDGSNTLLSVATRQASTAYDQVTITSTVTEGTNVKTAMLTILCKKGLTTSAGTLNANFSNGVSDDVFPQLTISNTANAAQSYASESGTVTITKLTLSEVEGTFSGHFINESENTSTELTNGSFAGKF